jgi:hypothetical protein
MTPSNLVRRASDDCPPWIVSASEGSLVFGAMQPEKTYSLVWGLGERTEEEEGETFNYLSTSRGWEVFICYHGNNLPLCFSWILLHSWLVLLVCTDLSGPGHN